MIQSGPQPGEGSSLTDECQTGDIKIIGSQQHENLCKEGQQSEEGSVLEGQQPEHDILLREKGKDQDIAEGGQPLEESILREVQQPEHDFFPREEQKSGCGNPSLDGHQFGKESLGKKGQQPKHGILPRRELEDGDGNPLQDGHQAGDGNLVKGGQQLEESIIREVQQTEHDFFPREEQKGGGGNPSLDGHQPGKAGQQLGDINLLGNKQKSKDVNPIINTLKQDEAKVSRLHDDAIKKLIVPKPSTKGRKKGPKKTAAGLVVKEDPPDYKEKNPAQKLRFLFQNFGQTFVQNVVSGSYKVQINDLKKDDKTEADFIQNIRSPDFEMELLRPRLTDDAFIRVNLQLKRYIYKTKNQQQIFLLSLLLSKRTFNKIITTEALVKVSDLRHLNSQILHEAFMDPAVELDILKSMMQPDAFAKLEEIVLEKKAKGKFTCAYCRKNLKTDTVNIKCQTCLKWIMKSCLKKSEKYEIELFFCKHCEEP